MLKIIIYSAPTCSYCDMAKKYLSDKKIEFINIDISKNKNAVNEIIKKTNQLTLPIIIINKQTIIGFNREAIDTAIKKATEATEE
jgi:glutaredoxin-like YruB-family protein